MVHRADLNSLSTSNRQQLVDLMLDYLNDSVVADHMNIIHSGVQIFTGHRAYIAGMEAFLSANGGSQFVPLPMWDPANPIPAEFNVVKPTDAGAARPPLVNLNPNRPLPPQYKFPAVCSFSTADDLGNDINGWHGSVHVAIGGTMGSFMIASAAPIFWCWHAFLDHVYYDWQFCQVIVPQCKGLRLGMARFRILHAGLKVGNITRIPSLIIRPEMIPLIEEETFDPRLLGPQMMPMALHQAHGDNVEPEEIIAFTRPFLIHNLLRGPRVIGQFPAAGTTVSHGSSVDLTVLQG